MWLVVLVVYLNEKPREVRPKYDRKILGCELLALRASALFHVYSSFACLRAPVSQASQRPDELLIDKDLLQHDGPHTQRERDDMLFDLLLDIRGDWIEEVNPPTSVPK